MYTIYTYIYTPVIRRSSYTSPRCLGGGRLVGSGTAQALRGALARLCGPPGAAGHGELDGFRWLEEGLVDWDIL